MNGQPRSTNDTPSVKNCATDRRINLRRRLTAYTASASAVAATGVGMNVAHAALVLRDIPDVTFSNDMVDIDVDGNGVAEFSLEHRATFDAASELVGAQLRVFPITGVDASVLINDTGAGPYLLPTVDVIDSQAFIYDTDSFLNLQGAAAFQDMAVYARTSPADSQVSTSYGAWVGGVADKFVGIKFKIDGTEHLGFAQISVEALDSSRGPFTATVSGFGYNDTPIGQTLGAALLTISVPEPTSLATLALGAVGVTRLRHHRAS